MRRVLWFGQHNLNLNTLLLANLRLRLLPICCVLQRRQ